MCTVLPVPSSPLQQPPACPWPVGVWGREAAGAESRVWGALSTPSVGLQASNVGGGLSAPGASAWMSTQQEEEQLPSNNVSRNRNREGT